MPIPSTTRKPGTFVTLDATSASQRGLAPIDRNVALLGARTGVVPVEVPYRVLTEGDADNLFGTGSELALMCRWALEAIRTQGKGPAIYAVPIADPGGGVKAIHRFAMTGPATAAGDAVFRIAGRTFRAGVKSGDTATVVANATPHPVDAALPTLPVTATVTGAGSDQLDLTAVQAGINGNDIKLEYLKQDAVAGVTSIVSAPTAGAGVYDITNALNSLVDRHYHAIAIANHLAADVTDLAAHIDVVGAAGFKKWTTAYLAERGSLSTATTLATGANRKETHVVTAEDFPNLPGEIAATLAATIEGEEDVALPFNDVELTLYVPPPASVYTDAEIETALAAGALPLAVNRQGTATKIVRAVNTKTVQGVAPFYAIADTSIVRTFFATAIQVDARLSRDFAQAKKNDRTKKRVRTAVLDVLKKLEELEWLQNVDEHAAEISVTSDPIVPSRLNVEIPASVIPPLNQLDVKLTLLLE